MRGDEDNAGRSVRALGWLNFFLADVQTGVGPFLAAYLAASAWNPRDTGLALTCGGLVTVALSPFAGALVDASRRKRELIAVATLVLSVGAVLIGIGTRRWMIGSAQVLVGGAGAFLPPAVAAMTLGIVGCERFDTQFGKNQSFNSAGNVFTALLLAGTSWMLGLRSIFFVAAGLALPVWMTLRAIDARTIDDQQARSGGEESEQSKGDVGRWQSLRNDRVLVMFFACSFLFHFANAAMLPELGEMLAKGNARAAAPFMSACIVVTQVVIAGSAAWIGRMAGKVGRKPLLLVGFGVLPLRGVLYAVTHATAVLIGIQVLDGVANAIFVVVSILVVADRMRGTGHFNLAQGALATFVGLGAALSNTYGGLLAHRFGFGMSFVGLAAVACVAWLLLWLAVPETLNHEGQTRTSRA